MDDYILVGRVTGAHGIHGAVKVHSYAESLDLYAVGEDLRLTLADGTVRTMLIEWVQPHGRGLRLGLEAVTDRTLAEDLTGASISVERSRLPALESDTYYWFELVGLDVYNTAGQLLGRLDEVIPTAAHDVYVVNGEIDGQPREWLIPAVASVVQGIDLEKRIMRVDPPEGL